MNKRTLAMLALSLALAGAEPPPKSAPTRRIPAVTRSLSSRYKLPNALSPASQHSVRDLADYVALQQRHFPGAVVTSGFYDWRTTSSYRSRAGLHLGYDVAMPYGCPFSAGWAGTVTAITPWGGQEYGITVVEPGGRSTTYGHVSPTVVLGQQVRAGEILGTIAYDHVDVKMRDAAGNYIDFGGNARVVPAPSWAFGMSREALMAQWLLAKNALELAEEDSRKEKLESQKRQIQIQALQSKVPTLQESQRLMADYVEQGLVSRLSVEENREELEAAQKELKRMKELQKSSPRRLQQLTLDVKNGKQKLAQAQQQASAQGIVWKDVEAFVQATIANDKALARSVSAYKKNAAAKNSMLLAQTRKEWEQSREQLKAFEELYEMGGISRQELEETRTKFKLLDAQLKALQGT
jgi:hypothetical protein